MTGQIENDKYNIEVEITYKVALDADSANSVASKLYPTIFVSRKCEDPHNSFTTNLIDRYLKLFK